MTEWKKIKHGGSVRCRTTPAVHRSETGAAMLVLPLEMATASRADVLTDGDERLAFHLHEGGGRTVSLWGKSKTVKIHFPAEFKGCIPVGTTDVELTKEGDFLVLDLNSLPGATA